MPSNALPKMILVRQEFPEAPAIDVRKSTRTELARILPQVRRQDRIAIGVGSRGISNLADIVREVVASLQGAGAQPFIVPAMGSHGGATPEGQKSLLAEYGVTEAALGVPIRAGMDTERIGATEDGNDVFFSAEALRADGVFVINRVKPHTDFTGALGSGVMKLLVVGLGKRTGAAHFHVASARFGYERVLRTTAKTIVQSIRLLGGLAIVENALHETARICGLLPGELERREEEILIEARRLMPKIPFDKVDLLIVDRLGKNISGAGMDPNVTGRWVHGYSSLLGGEAKSRPDVHRIFVRDLTRETHGNAVGIGLADLTTTRLVQGMDKEVTYINALTSLTPNCAKIPIHFDADREAIGRALDSIGLADVSSARIVRIQDTLSLEQIEVSAVYAEEMKQRQDLHAVLPARDMHFDEAGNLRPIGEEA